MSGRDKDADLSRIHYWVPVETRYADLDTQGHVNNATYLTYFEQARAHLLYTMSDLARAEQSSDDSAPIHQPTEPPGDVPFIPFVVIAASVSYRRPITGMVALAVGVRVGAISRASVEMRYAVCDRPGGTLYATGATTIIAIHPETGRPCSLPPATRAALERLASGDVPYGTSRPRA
ncbi:MAG TPA: thioesterase family protein [Ktedonobacterales bacterium]|nr:thioesterase family protein [Ktedonobacterales bacterium]